MGAAGPVPQRSDPSPVFLCPPLQQRPGPRPPEAVCHPGASPAAERGRDGEYGQCQEAGGLCRVRSGRKVQSPPPPPPALSPAGKQAARNRVGGTGGLRLGCLPDSSVRQAAGVSMELCIPRMGGGCQCAQMGGECARVCVCASVGVSACTMGVYECASVCTGGDPCVCACTDVGVHGGLWACPWVCMCPGGGWGPLQQG